MLRCNHEPIFHARRIRQTVSPQADYFLCHLAEGGEEIQMRHKHAALIHAWADGAIIQWKNLCGVWIDFRQGETPTWDESAPYRIKPEPKPDVVKTIHVSICVVLDGNHAGYPHNIRVTFDGETGALKAAEVIS